MDGHLSVVVRDARVTYFLAGDATYDQTLLKQRVVDGPSESIPVSLGTFDRISNFAQSEPTVLLPAHDPAAQQRLEERVLFTDTPIGGPTDHSSE